MYFEFDKVAYFKTPIGIARIVGDEKGISSISVLDGEEETSDVIPEPLQECARQLEEYFNKERKTFSLKLNPEGTDFQKHVWDALQQIPYGEKRSYMQQAEKLGDVKAIRAVANANAKNPLWIVIPCHRIIGSDGSMTGYAGGIWRKRWLLEHENPPKQQSLF